MNLYTVTVEFSAPQLGERLLVGATIGKYAGSTTVLVNATTYVNEAFWQWLGTANSLNYLMAAGVVPDPSTGGGGVGGTFAIPDGVSEVTVAGGAFGFVPGSVVCVVWKPSTPGSNIFATVREATITADGFTVDLSGPTPGAGYLLSYVVTA